jgi:hypothetical protein
MRFALAPEAPTYGGETRAFFASGTLSELPEGARPELGFPIVFSILELALKLP